MTTRRRTFTLDMASSKPPSTSVLSKIEGQLPRRALNLVLEWAMMHREELLEDWRFCRENRAPAKIEPLV